MASVQDRLSEALAPDYQIEREIGGGGMGLVFLARDVALDRRVAIKIIRPELATARATERFLREARTLAHLKHPNIMPVHRAGEAGGFAYFVMDYCEDGTLWERLERGPLDLRETIRLGQQLLDGLEVVHRAGLVHRDIKPANVFFLGGRAVLGDFGLAIPEMVGGSTPTEPAGVVGTPGYRPPELSAGGTATARTDIYAVGVVLYEAMSGQRWYAPAPEGEHDWSRVPLKLRPVLRRALAWSPDRRWPDAATFRRALRRAAGPTPWRWLAAAGGLAAAAVAAWIVWPSPPSMPVVHIRAFDALGVPGRPLLGDSLAQWVATEMAGTPEYRVLGPGDSTRRASVELRASLRADGGMLCATADLHRLTEQGADLPETCASIQHPAGLADSLARLTTIELWTGEHQLIADLPRKALPQTHRGVAAWARAERLFTQGRWGEADSAYREALIADTTCWLCSWRLFWAENWRGARHTETAQRFVAHLDLFPPMYRSVMRAGTLMPMAERLDTLREVTRRYPQFFFGLWTYGEEQFHRGPLLGRRRREALQSFTGAASMVPAFAPGWEHLAFLATAEGDSATAGEALANWRRAMGGKPRDPYDAELGAVLQVGFAWRFHPGPLAQGLVEQALRQPEVLAATDVAAGPRMLLMLDAPAGAVWLGGRFARMTDRPEWAKSGLLGRALGYVVLGEPDSARAGFDDLVSRFPEPEWMLFVAEYEAALAHLDSAGVPGWRAAAETALRTMAGSRAGSDAYRARAGGMLAVLSGGPSEGAAGEFGPFIRAWESARGQRWREALARSDTLLADPEVYFASPVLRALAHLDRADWWARVGDLQAAARELRWSEHWHVDGFPRGQPQAADVDWSLRSLARWRWAGVLDRAGRRDEEVCLAYRRVANAWSGGSPVFRVRADSARRRADALNCPPAL